MALVNETKQIFQLIKHNNDRTHAAAAGEPLKHKEYAKAAPFVSELDSSFRDFKMNAGV